MSEKLKPCPFCGGKSYIDIVMGRMYINCFHTKQCKLNPNTWLHADMPIKTQIKAWNRRADNG